MQNIKLLLLLYVLEKSGGIHTKIKLQKIMFLIQYYCHVNIYDFQTHHHGPYSKELDEDSMTSQYVICEKNISMHNNFEYFSFQISQSGIDYLHRKLKSIDKQLRKGIDDILSKYSNLKRGQLLELVYDKFKITPVKSQEYYNEVRQEMIPQVKSFLLEIYQLHRNRQSVYLLSVVEFLELVIEGLANVTDTTQRGVILNLVSEILEKINNIRSQILPPVNSSKLEPHFISIGELEFFLKNYCLEKNIQKEAIANDLEDILTEQDLSDIAEDLLKVKLD